MSNQYAALMREGGKLPPEAMGPDGRLEPFVPTEKEREQVRILASNGVAQDTISKVLGIVTNTLTKHFHQELEDGRDMVTAKMGFALVTEGFAGNVAAIKYWLLTRGGPEWKLTAADMRGLDPFAEARETVHFFMPSNGRDKPEAPEPEPGPPTIDGKAEEAA